MRSLTPKQFERFKERDESCYHCGYRGDRLVPGHRIDRGMGGSKLLDVRPSAIVTQCSESNGWQTSDAEFARAMEAAGIRLSRFPHITVEPLRTVYSPVFHWGERRWFMLFDEPDHAGRLIRVGLPEYLPEPVRPPAIGRR